MPRHAEATLAAVKNAIDIATLIGEYLPLHRAGSKFKALCPFHDDHHPSMEVNPERQSFKCWVCGAGGDVFDFVMGIDRVEFPEALRMLAERAGIALESAEAGPPSSGPSKSDLLAVSAWAESAFRRGLVGSDEARAYLDGRGIGAESVDRFGIGYAPDRKDWLIGLARRAGFEGAVLEKAGLATRSRQGEGPLVDRFRGRVIFPIRDVRGRAIGFGGRILPEVERRMAESGMGVAKYLNTPETAIFQKRRNLYAMDLARDAARTEGWVAVVEGYTDVVAAHQVGLANTVGTLGTALGDDHVQALRRLADRAVLVFDGDEAGQKAADRSLELFLNHELDVRVLTLPGGVDPCEFLLERGAGAFRELVEAASDPLDFAVDRATAEFDVDDVDGARRAADRVLGILASLPKGRAGLDLKAAKALDRLAHRVRLPVDALRRDLARRRKSGRATHRHVHLTADGAGSPRPAEPAEAGAAPAAAPIRPAELDALDRELITIILNQPNVVAALITRVAVSSLRDAPLRAILQACYDLYGEGSPADFEHVSNRLEEPAVRSLAAALLLPLDPRPLSERHQNHQFLPRPWLERFERLLPQLLERARQDKLRDLKGALAEIDPVAEPDDYRALRRELWQLLNRSPAARSSSLSDAS